MKAVIVDDHPLIQAAVGNVLRRLDADVAISVAGDCEQGLAMAAHGDEPDLVVLDLNLPGLSGIPAVRMWRSRFPAVPVVVVSAAVDQPTIVAAMAAGAAGFIPKSSANEVMVNALRLVLAGGKYLPPEVLAPSARRGAIAARQREGAPTLASLGLTERQTEVLRLIAKGAPNKVICRELGLADRTIKSHVTAVLRALKVSSRTQAAIEGAKLGLGDPPARTDHEAGG